jgi:phosphoserine phosphatase
MRRRTKSARERADEASSAALAGAAAAAVAEVEASLAMPPDPTAAAFFDVDNTMMQGASIYHFARGLAARDFFTWRDLAQFAFKQVAFRIKGVEDPAHMEEAKEAALAFVAGHKVSEVVSLGEEIYDDLMADRIWSGTRAMQVSACGW